MRHSRVLVRLTRWFLELADPALKCERLGHREVEFTRRGYAAAPHSAIYAAYRVDQTVHGCRRCGADLWIVRERRFGLSALKLPGRWQTVLAARGVVWTG